MAARFGLATALTLLVAATASAQTSLVNETFDTYADQAAFEAVWVPIGGGSPPGSLGVIGGTLSTEQAVSPTFSVKNVSPPAPMPPEPSTSAYSQRNQLDFTETGTISPTLGIRYSFDFYDLAPTAPPYRQFANLQDTTPTLSNQLIGMGMNNNQNGITSGGQRYMGRILGYTPATGADPDGGPDETQTSNGGVNNSGMFFKFNDFGDAGLRSEGWHNLKVEITTDDGLSSDYNFYVDGVLAESVLNFGTDLQFRSYDVIRMGSGNSSTQDAYYDNFIVETFVVGTEPEDDADFDGDGDVDGSDFLIWQLGAGDPGDQADGDANGDNVVDGLDLDVWEMQFGQPAPPVSAIPEPASLALLAVAALAGLAVARHR